MARPETSEQRNRIVRIALAGVAALFAVRAFRRGDRAKGALAALGAVALGASARPDDASEGTDVDGAEAVASAGADDTGAAVSIEAPGESEAKLRCAACGEPIVPGQRRGPDEHDRTVHEACLEAPA